MRNTSIVNEVQHCYCCKRNGVFVYTPDGADYSTCPCCDSGDFLNNNTADRRIDALFDEYDGNDMRHKYSYCGKLRFCSTQDVCIMSSDAHELYITHTLLYKKNFLYTTTMFIQVP
jgi:hypothetical protein